jgi:protein-arginine kinase activator protein McsA
MNCKECGEKINFHFEEKTKERLARLSLCFDCDHWNSLYESSLVVKPGDGQSIRCDNGHFMIGPENASRESMFRGFGGAKFIFVMDDGTRIESTNVWHQGKIPEHWRERLPNNAKRATEGGG